MRAHRITQDLPSKRGRAHALNLVGESLRAIGRCHEAIPYYLELTEYHTLIDSIDTPASFLNLAFNAIELRQFESAVEYGDSVRVVGFLREILGRHYATLPRSLLRV